MENKMIWELYEKMSLNSLMGVASKSLDFNDLTKKKKEAIKEMCLFLKKLGSSFLAMRIIERKKVHYHYDKVDLKLEESRMDTKLVIKRYYSRELILNLTITDIDL